MQCPPDGNGDVCRYFTGKVYRLLGDIKGVKSYIDNIRVLNNSTFVDHM